MSVATEKSTLYLVGIRIDADVNDPQLFTIYVDDDRPIMSQRRPVVFTRPALAAAALLQSDCGAARFGPAPTSVYTVFDLAAAIRTLSEHDEEQGNEVLDCLNGLLDFANCIATPLPTKVRSALADLADHLTFNKRFAEFLADQNLTRQDIANAVYSALGSSSAT